MLIKTLQPSLCHSLMTNTSCELDHIILTSTQVLQFYYLSTTSLTSILPVLEFVSALVLTSVKKIIKIWEIEIAEKQQKTSHHGNNTHKSLFRNGYGRD